MKKVTLFKGDGIGPEICDQVVRIIDSLNLPLEFEPFEVGAAEYERHGALIPAAAFDFKGTDNNPDRQGVSKL